MTRYYAFFVSAGVEETLLGPFEVEPDASLAAFEWADANAFNPAEDSAFWLEVDEAGRLTCPGMIPDEALGIESDFIHVEEEA